MKAPQGLLTCSLMLFEEQLPCLSGTGAHLNFSTHKRGSEGSFLALSKKAAPELLHLKTQGGRFQLSGRGQMDYEQEQFVLHCSNSVKLEQGDKRVTLVKRRHCLLSPILYFCSHNTGGYYAKDYEEGFKGKTVSLCA